MKAYSVDLRERVVAAVDAGMPRPAAARLFRVSVATIKRYLKRRRETGDLTPEIAPALYPALAAQVAAHADDTREQHCATWAAEQREAVSGWALQRALDRAGITRKERRCSPPSATRRRGLPGTRTPRRSPRQTSSSWTRRRRTAP